MDQEELFLRIDIMNLLNQTRENLDHHEIDKLMKLYHALCDFNEMEPNEYFVMQDKNSFRELKEKDLRENKKWYHDLVDSIKEDIDAMLELVISAK